jgi:hypothetical protein
MIGEEMSSNNGNLNVDQSEKRRSYTISATTQLIEKSFDCTQPIKNGRVFLKATQTTSSAAVPFTDEILANIQIKPTGYEACIDISGIVWKQWMKLINRGPSQIDEDPVVVDETYIHTRKEIYEFNFEDYNNMLRLGLPIDGKSVKINLMLNTHANISSVGDSSTNPITVELTIQLTCDAQTIPQGFRIYNSETKPISRAAYQGREFVIDLPQLGMIDSILLYKGLNNSTPANSTIIPIEDIEIVLNDTIFLHKSIREIDEMLMTLNKASSEALDPGYLNINLARPVPAKGARKLQLKLKLSAVDADWDGIGSPDIRELIIYYENVKRVF